MRICHITTVHQRNDVRIFHKQCKSLAEIYTDIHLVVADSKGNEIKDGIKIHDIGKNKTRLSRFTNTVSKALKKAIEIDADVYHIHDPELLRILKKLKTKKIIYDSHEDVPRQILSKHYIPKIFRQIISTLFENYENRICKNLDVIICATPFIRDRFVKINHSSFDVNNFPIVSKFDYKKSKYSNEKSIGYIGGIFKTRGIIEMLDLISGTDITLHLGGFFSPSTLLDECQKHPGWKNTIFYGFISRDKVNDFFGKINAGIVILESTPSYIVSLPVKMFEYMAAGLPVIASDFPLWKEIVEESNSGICVNPKNISEMKEKVHDLLLNENLRREMGHNGRTVVETKYNWELEKRKLFHIYKTFNNE